jgi:diguanylate cyclase (GGDEF)-like protein
MFHAGHAHLHGAGGHGLGDMALMFAVACALSFAVLDAACRVRAAHGHARLLWLVSGSLTVGLGIWALHFVALLSLQLPIPMTEDPMTLGVAAVTAVIAAAGALHHVDRGVSGIPPLAVSGGLKGFALIATHYTNMAALHVPASIQYDPKMVAVSVVLAVTISVGMLSFAERLRAERPLRAFAERLAAALAMGASLTIMHHAAMASGRFIPDDIWREHFYRGGHVHLLPEAWLEPWVAGAGFVAVTVLGVAAALSRWRHLRHASRPASDRLTGMPNGALLRDALSARLDAARACAIIAVRVERFEDVGHRLGRREAERLLVRVGLRLRAAVRPTDLAARLGGAEYGVLVDDPDAAGMVVERVRGRLAMPVKSGALQVVLPVDVGVAIAMPGDAPRDVLARAQLDAARAAAPRHLAPLSEAPLSRAA